MISKEPDEVYNTVNKETIKKFIPQKILLKRALIMYRHRVKTVLKKRVIKPYKPSEFPKGINLIGPFKAQIGLGQSCRLLANASARSDRGELPSVRWMR